MEELFIAAAGHACDTAERTCSIEAELNIKGTLATLLHGKYVRRKGGGSTGFDSLLTHTGNSEPLAFVIVNGVIKWLSLFAEHPIPNG